MGNCPDIVPVDANDAVVLITFWLLLIGKYLCLPCRD